jgi:two-component system chemotaxis sensor kinase CheA
VSPEEIQQIFFVECEESLAAAEGGLAALRAGDREGETVNAVFRAIHSIKGGAGAFGFAALQAYTHTFETLLSDVRDGTVEIAGALVDLLLRALDTLSDHVTAAREGGAAPDDAALLGELEAARSGAPSSTAPAEAAEPAEQEPAAPPATDDDDLGLGLDAMLDDLLGSVAPAEPVADEASPWSLQIRPHAAAMGNGSEPLLHLRELARLGGECSACNTNRIPPLDSFAPGESYLEWTFEMPAAASESAVREVFDFNADEYDLAFGDTALPPLAAAAPLPEPSPAPAHAPAPAAAPAAEPAPAPAAAATAAAPPAAGQSIRIDLAKLDRLIDSVGELVIAQAMMAQRLAGDGLTAGEELSLLETLTRDIQENAMSIRAQPIGSVFSRVPRILRELAASTGKHVRLEVIGEGTELDKTVIERLGEPLTHLIRNAVDHGIESAEERIAAGKNPEGTLTLAAEQRSGRIRIRISDDGKGIDRDRVFAKAVEKGLIAPDAQLSREEIENLIFAPGFSTAQTVSNVSGRGVGMDVVRRNIKELGGAIEVRSTAGRGSRFIITLPLTLAIVDGQSVSVGTETYIVPLVTIIESLQLQPGGINRVGGHQEVFWFRDGYVPVVRLHEVFGVKPRATELHQGLIMVVEGEGRRVGLFVDDLLGQQQVVIKSLETNFRRVEGVSGATILGDGAVALILDVPGLIRVASLRAAA